MSEEDPMPALHPLVEGFGDAETYDRGRHTYDAEAARVLIELLGLRPEAPVLELGAGTGQLSRALVSAGLSLIAVEPLAPTRALLERAIGPGRVLSGVAEEIPLADGSVDAVLAANAFHWFDESRAMAEIERVLAPGGGLAILSTVPVLDTRWGQELGAILMEARPEHPAFGERGPAAALDEHPAFGPVVHEQVSAQASFDRARMLAYVASLSWVGGFSAAERAQLLDRVSELLDRHGIANVEHTVLHQIWVARLL
jgi:SAM-dependent methyltransferase